MNKIFIINIILISMFFGGCEAKKEQKTQGINWMEDKKDLTIREDKKPVDKKAKNKEPTQGINWMEDDINPKQ